jgi:hypothetical protein
MAGFDGLLARRVTPPERLADQHRPARAEAALQQADRAGDTAADPGGPDAGRDVAGVLGDVT